MASSSTYKNVLSGTIWGVASKVIAAITNFISIPLLVNFYGKSDYGLVALIFSLNAYLRIMDMGINIGSVRFFAREISENNWDKVEKVTRSSIVFYGVIGLLNALLFVVIAENPDWFFHLSPKQTPVFKIMMYVLVGSTILNWVSNVMNHLLSAYESVSWMNKMTALSSIASFVTALISIYANLSLSTYFLLYTLSSLIIIPLNLFKVTSLFRNLLTKETFFPKWFWEEYKSIIKYSMAIFAMGIFQYSADNLRPLILEYKSAAGTETLTDYRIIQTISSLVMTFGGVFLQVLLPSASKLNMESDFFKIEKLVYDGTRYISAFIVFCVFILSINSKEILLLYMGKEYQILSIWVIVWLFSLLGMHNSPVSSLILSSGKTKPLVYISALSCMVSLAITALFANEYDVGAAVIGYAAFIVIQNIFSYFYYIPVVLKLDANRIFFQSFMPSLLIGILIWIFMSFALQYINIRSSIESLILKSGLFIVLYVTSMLFFVIKPVELKLIIIKIISKDR